LHLGLFEQAPEATVSTTRQAFADKGALDQAPSGILLTPDSKS
jgi:hypothetical protein